jgi:16S rRNA A1518/A1519 N6-dimethyltransferase RsmA/KsgA/DIM1 with predicted DNA glycosylase/AP lyase activity
VPNRMMLTATLIVAGCVAMLNARGAAPARPMQAQQPLDVIYVPTPHQVVKRMLEVAKVGPGDVVFDLGSGDGRIPIAAVKDFDAARGVGIELDPQRIAEARTNAVSAGVSDRVQFVQQDLFEADLSEATVIAMYLLPAMNARLYPKLRALKPGTRITTHNYDFGKLWKPRKTLVVDNNLVHLWTVPKR